MARPRNRISIAAAGGGLLASLSFGAGIAAQGYDSTVEELIGALTEELVLLAVAVAVVFEVILLYVVVRYRNSGNAAESRDNPRFLSSYVLAIGVILFFVGVGSFQTFAAIEERQPQAPPPDAERVHVIAEQWSWTFEYPDEGVTTGGTLVVPANETIHLNMTSEDVVHSLHAPELGLKKDAHPAQWNYLTFTPTTTGEYDLFCAEYCGQGHSTMLATIRVMNETEYDGWLEDRRDD